MKRTIIAILLSYVSSGMSYAQSSYVAPQSIRVMFHLDKIPIDKGMRRQLSDNLEVLAKRKHNGSAVEHRLTAQLLKLAMRLNWENSSAIKLNKTLSEGGSLPVSNKQARVKALENVRHIISELSKMQGYKHALILEGYLKDVYIGIDKNSPLSSSHAENKERWNNVVRGLDVSLAVDGAKTEDEAKAEKAVPEKTAPVKVYILAGQSNMVGMGQVTGATIRWGNEFQNAVVSVYEGNYDEAKDYDALKPIKTLKLESFGGSKPTVYPGGGTQVTRGTILPKESGVFNFNPGYEASSKNIMVVNGVEVYRSELDKLTVRKSIKLEAGKAVPFKITYVEKDAGGLGWMWHANVPGTLETLVHEEGKFPYLINERGSWVSRDDVWYKGVVTARSNKWLSVGCGVDPNRIGPELGFGHAMGNYHDEPVLIIKASQGKSSLLVDFLPPGSKRFEHEGKIYAGYKDTSHSWVKGTTPKPAQRYAGEQYDDCFGGAKKELVDFDKNFPQWKGRGYEIAGFVWWQGHRDAWEPAASRYEQNLVKLIKSLREDFKAPTAPFVVATVGFGGWKMDGFHKKVADAQIAVGDGSSDKYSEFKGNVKTIETRGFWRDLSKSPINKSSHYNQNAETYMLVGEEMAKGMLELKHSSSKQ